MNENLKLNTKLLHSDRFLQLEYGSLHQPIHTSVAFHYDKVQDLCDIFQGKKTGYAYSRQSHPTGEALQNKISLSEKCHSTICFSTGMSAIQSTLFALLQYGDHLISSSFLFGNTNSLFRTFNQLGIEVDFVDPTQVENVNALIKKNTRAVFLETIANPVTQIADLYRIGDLCRDKKILYIVDNTLTTPFGFNPVNCGAGLIINSLTKYIGGHGDALGGAISDGGQFDWELFPNILDIYKTYPKEKWGITQIKKKGLRDGGGSISPESAHSLSIGMDTLLLRYEKASQNALKICQYLSKHPKVSKVFYPGLEVHPQHKNSKKWFNYHGALFSYELKDIDCLQFIDKLELFISSSNLGDNRSLNIPVAHTIYYEMGPHLRKEMGIGDNLIRVSTGIEDCDDLISDLKQAFEQF